ncbi:hypothetical protein Tco_1323239, partial [Tanacetum coccineum]
DIKEDEKRPFILGTPFLTMAKAVIKFDKGTITLRSGKGRKAHLLEDKQIPSVGVFDEVFSIWKAFGGNTRDLGLFGEETDKTTDLHQHFLRLCSQRLETASQDTCDAVTIHPMMVSQESITALACTTQPKI